MYLKFASQYFTKATGHGVQPIYGNYVHCQKNEKMCVGCVAQNKTGNVHQETFSLATLMHFLESSPPQVITDHQLDLHELVFIAETVPSVQKSAQSAKRLGKIIRPPKFLYIYETMVYCCRCFRAPSLVRAHLHMAKNLSTNTRRILNEHSANTQRRKILRRQRILIPNFKFKFYFFCETHFFS